VRDGTAKANASSHLPNQNQSRIAMAVVWSDWKHFPDPRSGLALDAPAGCGVFEVRHMATGSQVAFAVSAKVAASLENLVLGQSPGLLSIFTRHRISHRPADLEYRTCAAASMSEARAEADRLNGLRRAYFQRRKASGWA
jgi:hypothetical protein